jgi:putative transposase
LRIQNNDRSHKIELKPNNKQRTYFAKASGTARFSYNWALDQWQKQYQSHKENPDLPKPTQGGLRKQLNAIKHIEYPWMLEVTKNAPQMAIIQLGEAFKRFFKGQASYPKFKRKGVHDSFTITNDQFLLNESLNRIRIPNLGWVWFSEPLRFNGKILSATITREANKWFVSISVETDDLSHLHKAENQGIVGVDLGISSLATLSTGEVVTGSKPLKTLLSRLKKLSRNLSKKQKGSANWYKAKTKLAKLHVKISNIRKDTLHKLTSNLTRRFCVIGIEDLNVKGMLSNRKLARHIVDMGFYEFKRQLEYKAQMRGNLIVIADRWYPSSKTCSACGAVKQDLTLKNRIFTSECGHTQYRDLNAAINLAHYAVSYTV